MDSYAQMLAQIKRSPAMERFIHLYGRREGELARQLTRYTQLVKAHEDFFHAADAPLYMISAPGRTEIIGNHTDHNNGRVLAAAVNLDCLACVSPRDDMNVRIFSAGYPAIELSLADLSIHPEEEGTSAALVRKTGNVFWLERDEKQQNSWVMFGPEYKYIMTARVYDCGGKK